MGPIGAQEMIFIFILALLLFGPKKLPELGRMLGKGLTEFRRAKNELKTTFESHMQELEREAKLADQPEKPKWEQSSGTEYSSASYPYPYDEYGRYDTAAGDSGVSTTGSDPTPAASASNGTAATHSAPVPGTVPRSSAISTPEPVGASTDEHSPA